MATEENKQTQDILDIFYKNVSEKNAELITTLFADKFEWYIPKSSKLAWTGKLREKSEITKNLKLLFEAHEDGHDFLETDHVFIEGNNAAVFGRMTRKVKKTGKNFTTDFCQRFTISNGKIIKFLMLEDTPEIEKAF